MPTDQPDPDVTASAPRPSIVDDPNRHPFWPASDRCRICDRVECRRRELSIAYYRLDDRGKPKRGKDAEWHAALEALAPVADECARLKVDWRAEALGWRAKATTPPAIPAALAALLREQSEAWAAIDTAPAPDYQSACERSQDADAALREWTRAHAGAVASTPAAACICRRDDEGEWLPGSEDCPRWGLDDEHPLTEGSTRARAAPAPLTDDELAAMWRLRIGTSPSPNGLTLMRAIRDHAGGGR